jgi:putative transposase
VKYAFVEEHRMEFRITAMCRVLSIHSSGYYAWRKRKPPRRAAENERLLERITAIHARSRSTYGSPRVHQQLRGEGEKVNHKRVSRLMRENALRAKRVRKFKATTDSRHNLPVAENVLGRNFRVDAPDRVWTSDITYIWTDEGWLYLSVFLDLYSRLVVGWAVSESLETKMVEEAFLQGQARRGRRVSPLVHSDRGCQYASAAFTQRLAAWECRQSMSRKGNCWDNAVTESFFATLKTELIHHERYRTRQEARDQLFDYIEVFYNRQRIHSTIGYSAPAEYEARYRAQLTQAA